MVRVRFAPSPTGYLHVGGLRTALYNYLLANKTGGSFILRIDDTDRSRYVEGAVETFLTNLRWAGIVPNEGASIGGDCGPYVQSDRAEIHREHARRLVEQGDAYYCFCSAEQLEAMRSEQTGQGEHLRFDVCRSVDPGAAAKRVAAGEPYVVRMKVPSGETVVVNDLVRGPVSFDTSVVDDQVLIKSDGFPTYHLATVVDDQMMGITHVLRGEEWLSSTPKHVLLYRFFGWELPTFAHLPLILNTDRKKLSKRDGDVSVEAFRAKGYLPEALINFLALLGWSPGDDREFFTISELVEAFRLERVHKSGAVFDLSKLDHLNSLHIQAATTDRLVEQLTPFLSAAGVEIPDREYLGRVVDLLRDRVVRLTDVAAEFRYFFDAPSSYDPAAMKKWWKPHSGELISKWIERLREVEWTKEALEQSLRALAAEQNLGAGHLIHPTRLVLSGVGSGPGLFELMTILGRETSLQRMGDGVERIAMLQTEAA